MEVAALQEEAQNEAEQAAVERLRKKLANIAQARREAAIKQIGKNAYLYQKFLEEAAAMDPDKVDLGGKPGARRRSGS
jgi:hypothetical protein